MAEGKDPGFRDFFNIGKGLSDSYIDNMLDRLRRGKRIKFSEMKGSLEAKVQAAADEGRIHTAEDVRRVMDIHYGNYSGTEPPELPPIRKSAGASAAATPASPPAFSDADYARYRALQNAKDSGAPMNPKQDAELKDLGQRFQASLGGPAPKQASLPAAVPPPPPGPKLPGVLSYPRLLPNVRARLKKDGPEIVEPPNLRADWMHKPKPPEPSGSQEVLGPPAPPELPEPPPMPGNPLPAAPAVVAPAVTAAPAESEATAPNLPPAPYAPQATMLAGVRTMLAYPAPNTTLAGTSKPTTLEAAYPELASTPPPTPTPPPPPYQNVPPPPGTTGAFPKAEFAAPRQNVPPGSVGGSPPPGRNFGGFGDTAYAGAPYKGVDFDLGSIKRPPAFIDSVLNFLAGGRASGLNPAGDSTDSGRGGILAEILAELKAIRELLGGQRGGVASRGSLFSPGVSLSDTEGYPTASPSVNESSRTGMRGAGGWGFGSLSPFLGEMAANFLEPRRRDPR